MENIYFNKAMSASTILITLLLHYVPCCCYYRITMTVANARVSNCPFVHPSVKCIGVCSQVSMSSKGFNQSPLSSLKSKFEFYYSSWNFNFFFFSGDSKQKFVLFLIHQERWETRLKLKTGPSPTWLIMVCNIGSSLSVMLLNWAWVDKGGIKVLPCLWESFRVTLWAQEPSKRWEGSMEGSIANATHASRQGLVTLLSVEMDWVLS